MMKVLACLLLCLLAYVVVTEALPSLQSGPDMDGMVDGAEFTREKRGLDDIESSFSRNKREIDGPTYFYKWLEPKSLCGGTWFATKLLLKFLMFSWPGKFFNKFSGTVKIKIRAHIPSPFRMFF